MLRLDAMRPHLEVQNNKVDADIRMITSTIQAMIDAICALNNWERHIIVIGDEKSLNATKAEGLYHHQAYIQRQLFVQTADEPYLYIHAEELQVPRLGGTRASGIVKAKLNAEITIEAGTKLTDGKGHFWSVISTTVIQPNITTEISVTADQIGASWNFTGTSLMWVSPIAGLNGTAKVVSIAGGLDEEELEAWRARMLESKQLGQARDRESDLERAMKSIPGIGKIYIYKKRRGLGSMDVAITAVGSPPTLPAQALLDSAQIVLDEEAGFWADCRVYSPTQQLIDITAAVKGMGVNFTDVETTIRNYIAELAPVEEYQANVLVSRIMALANVEDVTLTPSINIQPIVNWMHTYWLRAGTVAVSAAT